MRRLPLTLKSPVLINSFVPSNSIIGLILSLIYGYCLTGYSGKGEERHYLLIYRLVPSAYAKVLIIGRGNIQ